MADEFHFEGTEKLLEVSSYKPSQIQSVRTSIFYFIHRFGSLNPTIS